MQSPINRITTLVALLFYVGSGSAHAHHSGISFDTGKTVTVTGEVKRFIWRNPHMAINMTVTDSDGVEELWKIEGPGSTALSKLGLNKKTLNIGDKITVMAHPLKSGKPSGLLQGLTLADGTSFGVTNDYEVPPARKRVIPALLEWEPPPAGETWRERERKTRPSQLPIIGGNPRQTGPGALDRRVAPHQISRSIAASGRQGSDMPVCGQQFLAGLVNRLRGRQI